MKKYQEIIYKFTLIFSALVNLLLLGLLFLVVRDNFAGKGSWYLEGRSFWFFLGTILVFSLANSVFIIRFLKFKSLKE